MNWGDEFREPLTSGTDSPVNELILPTRVGNVFGGNGIVTVLDLIRKSPGDLLRLDNFGKVSLKDVEDALHFYGLRLRVPSAKEARLIRLGTPEQRHVKWVDETWT